MTEEEVMVVINNVANRLARRFKFGYHEIDDMRQQARLFAWEGLEHYDGVRPLENFLWTHVHNRLFNFKRDKYERPGKPCADCGNCQYDDLSGDDCLKFPDKMECEPYSMWAKRSKRKKNLMNPIDISNIDDEHEKNMSVHTDPGRLTDYDNMMKIIDRELPTNLRAQFLRLKFGTKLSKVNKIKIQTTIREILEKNGYGQY
jgi:hypothetical protein